MPEREAESDPKLPRRAILKNIGVVRIISYSANGGGYFYVLDSQDEMRLVRRERLTFISS